MPPIELWQERRSTPELINMVRGKVSADDGSFAVADLQVAALTILAKRPKDKEVAVPAIIESLPSYGDEAARMASTTLQALGETDESGEPMLDAALRHESIALRFRLTYEARRLKSPSQACVPYLDSSNAETRLKAARWLALLGDKAAATEPALQKLQKNDPDPDVRLAAGEALRKISKKAVFPALLEGLKDADPVVRGRAAQALVKSGADAVPTLRTALQEKDRDVRASAIAALGRIGPVARGAADDLRTLLKDDDPLTRKLAADALGKIVPEAP